MVMIFIHTDVGLATGILMIRISNQGLYRPISVDNQCLTD